MTGAHGTSLTGRGAETDHLDLLLRNVRTGASQALVIHGEAGVGKTPLLESVTDHAGAMFHDVGLTEPYRTTSMSRFEVDSADLARDFLMERGVDAALARTVWLGIALHTTPGVPQLLEPEIALVSAGVEIDVLGIGRDELSPESLAAVTAAQPATGHRRDAPTPPHHGRHGQRGRAGALRAAVQARRPREDHPRQWLAGLSIADPRSGR